MANTTAAPAGTVPQQPPITTYPGIGSVVTGSRRTRPLWFNGRFLAARDLERDQNYFLARQAALGRAAGFGVIHGLMVDTVSAGGSTDAETLIVRAGHGLTPSGKAVVIPEDLTVRISDLASEQNLEVQFGISEAPTPVERTRTGLYVLALRPVQFTANPITSYPSNIQGSRTTHDGNIVEATAVSLVPYPDPSNNFDATTRLAALARQIFATDNSGPPAESLLPLAMVSIQGGAIEWIDVWLVRRVSSPESSGRRLGLADPATQQAFLLQYDSRLLSAVSALANQSLPAQLAASEYFQALPPAGRFPLASIDTGKFTQLFFPPQTDVLLSIIPSDELPAVMEDSLSLPPIDLTLPAASYADLGLFLLVPVARSAFAALAADLAPVALSAAVPQVLTNRKPLDLLRFFPSGSGSNTASGSWQQAIGSQTYGYFVRRRSSPLLSTSTALTASLSEDNTSLSLTATLTPAAATGLVVLQDASVDVGSGILNRGSATVILTSISPGAHSLTATYEGDGIFSGSTSAILNLTVPPPKTNTTTTLAVVTIPGAGAGLPFSYDITATVKPANATGQVTLQLGPATLTFGNLSGGKTEFTLGSDRLSSGPNVVTAVYGGDANFSSSTSTPATLTGTGGPGS